MNLSLKRKYISQYTFLASTGALIVVLWYCPFAQFLSISANRYMVMTIDHSCLYIKLMTDAWWPWHFISFIFSKSSINNFLIFHKLNMYYDKISWKQAKTGVPPQQMFATMFDWFLATAPGCYTSNWEIHSNYKKVKVAQKGKCPMQAHCKKIPNRAKEM